MIVENNWEGVAKAAARHGSRFPELVAAQWALESGYGKAPSGRHNYVGLKSVRDSDPLLATKEEINGRLQPVKDRFMNFDSLDACIEYLVTRWYKDYKSYKGVNNASSQNAAARELVRQGYATDSNYAIKLINLMSEQSQVKAAPEAVAVKAKPAVTTAKPEVVHFSMTATQDTYLKKEPVASGDLKENQLVFVPKGKTYGVVMLRELAHDSHSWVKLSSGSGEWFNYGPHWRRVIAPAATAPVSPTSSLLTLSPNWDDFGQYVTQNLTVGEIVQWDRRRRPVAGSLTEKRLLQTAEQFQQIRNAWGRQLDVTSFFRPEPVNSEVGGVPGSRHVSGEAMDIYPTDGRLSQFYEWILRRWTGGLGDGRHRGFIHLDIRNNGGFVPGAGRSPVAVWTY